MHYESIFRAAHADVADCTEPLLEAWQRAARHAGPQFEPLGVRMNKSGDHVMHVLCRRGQVKACNELGRAHFQGRLGSICNYEGKTLLHEAAQFCQPEVVTWLLQDPSVCVDSLKRADWTPLMLACTKKGNTEVVKRLLEAEAQVHLKNKDGWTSFHLAVREGDVATLDALLGRDDSVQDTVSNNGRTPLHTAALLGQSKVVTLLLDLGGSSKCVDLGDSCGSTPIMDAARSGHVNTLAQLIDAGHSVHVTDSLQRNALHIAAHSNQAAVIEFLLCRHKMSPDESSHLGMTPLHWAALEGQTNACKILVLHDANPLLVDQKGRSPLQIALDSRKAECTHYLQQVFGPDSKPK